MKLRRNKQNLYDPKFANEHAARSRDTSRFLGAVAYFGLALGLFHVGTAAGNSNQSTTAAHGPNRSLRVPPEVIVQAPSSTAANVITIPSTATTAPTTVAITAPSTTTTRLPETTVPPTTSTTLQPPAPVETAPTLKDYNSLQTVGSLKIDISGADPRTGHKPLQDSVTHTVRTGEKVDGQPDVNGNQYYDVNPAYMQGFAWHSETPLPSPAPIGTTVIGSHHKTPIKDPDNKADKEHPANGYGLLDIADVAEGDMAYYQQSPEEGGLRLQFEKVGETWKVDTRNPDEQAKLFSQEDPNVQLRVYNCDDDTTFRTVIDFRFVGVVAPEQ